MFKLLFTAFIVVPLLLSWQWGNSQQPVVVVKSFDYIWTGIDLTLSGPTQQRVIIASDDSAKKLIKNSFVKAIETRWNVALPEVSLTVKRLPVFAQAAKFKTQVKEKYPGVWYVFLQVYDKGKFTGFNNNESLFYTELELKCRILSGMNDSLIMDKVLSVKIFEQAGPGDQVLLTRLPAYPPDFIEAFDSVARWLFHPEPITNKSLILKPACIFEENNIKETPLTESLFNSGNDSIRHLAAPYFSFNTSGAKNEKTGVKRKTGSNIATGALTLFTGIGSSKSKLFDYKADLPFKDGNDSSYHCLIAYTEEELAERERVRNDDGSYSMNSKNYQIYKRYVDTAILHFLTQRQDTLATFKMRYLNGADENKNYNRMWDGSDSSTITDLRKEWVNKEKETTVIVSGMLEGVAFTMKTSKDLRIKEFYINDQLIAIIQGKENPEKAFVFRPVSSRQFKLLTILSALPYAYFNKTDQM